MYEKSNKMKLKEENILSIPSTPKGTRIRDIPRQMNRRIDYCKSIAIKTKNSYALDL